MGEQLLDTESRRALHELIDLLGEVDRRWASPEWNLHTVDDVVGAHRALMHYLQWGLVGLFERDPAAPRFHRIVAPDRKLLGDNPDAVYFDASISADHAYRVTGETKGATYVSITVESGAAWGSMDNQVVGVLNDTSFDIDADGRFEILLGGEPRQRNWLALPEGAGSISTRHYFEDATHAAADPARVPAMRIEVVPGGGNPVPAGSAADSAVAAGTPPVPSGTAPVPSGTPPVPSGNPPVPSGNPPVPSATRPSPTAPRPPRRPARRTPPWPPASAGSPPWCASSLWTARRRASPSPVRGSRGCPTSSRPPASPATWAWPPSTPPTPWPRL